MFTEGILIGLIVGKLRGGRFGHLSHMNITMWPLLVIALMMQIIFVFSSKISFLVDYAQYVYMGSMILLLIGVLINLNKKGFWLLGTGIMLNLAVFILNGYRIPISLEGLKLTEMTAILDAIKSGQMAYYMPLEEVAEWFKFLGKFIVIPKPYPLPKVISIGDIFITLGVIVLIQGEMLSGRGFSRSRMIKFGYRGRI
ncbi:MAG: DUF5317 domain-containing protein [Bacillota bacterium]